MNRRFLWFVPVALLIIVGGYGFLKIKAAKQSFAKLREPPPIADFVRPPAGAPKTPFRLVWQHIDPQGLTFSPDWKLASKTAGEWTHFASLKTGKLVRSVKGNAAFPPSAKMPPLSRITPKITNSLAVSDDVEAISQTGYLAVIRGFGNAVYDLKSGRKLWRLPEREYGPVVALDFSPDGRWLLTREEDAKGENVRHFLRDARRGTILRRFDWFSVSYQQGTHGEINAAPGFSPDGKRFAVYDQGLKIYAIPTGKLVLRWDGFGGNNIELARDGQTVFTAGDARETIAFWNPKTDRAEKRWSVRYNASGALKTSPDGKYLASGSNGSCGRDLVRVRELSSGKELWVAPSGYNSDGVADVEWSPDGTLLATASGDINGAPQIWNAKTGERVAVLGGTVMRRGTQAFYTDKVPERREPTLFWLSDARELWVGGNEGIKIWSREGDFLRQITPTKTIESMARCPSGQRVVLGTKDEIILLRVQDQTILWRKKVGPSPQVAFLPSERVVASIPYDEKRRHPIQIWDARGGFVAQSLEAPLGTYRVAVSADGRHIAAIGGGGIMVWDSAP